MTEEAPERGGKGLRLGTTAAFIVAEMAGIGVLALPHAMANASWAGIGILILYGINTLYAGICLGQCWIILEERYDKYRSEKNRSPYPAIIGEACGKKMMYFVSYCLNFTLMVVGTVFLLLASQMAELATGFDISFCYWVVILAIALTPLMWLGTPEDFWPVALVSLTTLVTATVLLLVGLLSADNAPDLVQYPQPTPMKVFEALGTIFFAFGGVSCFPTLQNDMEDRSQFPVAATIGFGILILLFLPLSLTGYIVYGAGNDAAGRPYLKHNVLESLPESPVKTAVRILLSVQLNFAFLVIVNTPSQAFEESLGVPKHFGWRRVVLRTGVMILITFVAQSIPRFGKILNFIGGSTASLCGSIFPCYFYMRLCMVEEPHWPKRYIPLVEKIYMYVIMILSAVGGAFATYSAVLEIVKPDRFNAPCYINITAASMPE